jgi:hypothetical protein
LAPPAFRIASIRSARPGIGGDGIETNKFIGSGGGGGAIGGPVVGLSMLRGGATGTFNSGGSGIDGCIIGSCLRLIALVDGTGNGVEIPEDDAWILGVEFLDWVIVERREAGSSGT